MSFIDLQAVSRLYSTEVGSTVKALDEISVQIEEGEYLCITGSSGSGKSTLLNILGCLDSPSEGRYSLRGRDIANLSDREKSDLRLEEFGFVFQRSHLLRYATLDENVQFPCAFTSMNAATRRSRTEHLLERTRLLDRRDHFPDELSGGERQRVAIARALMNGATTILADEPTAALDMEQKESVLGLLRELASHDCTVIVASHDPLVARSADRNLTLRAGKIENDVKVRDHVSRSSLSGDVATSPIRPSLTLARLSNWFRNIAKTMRREKSRVILTTAATALAMSLVLTVISAFNSVNEFGLAIMGKIGLDTIEIHTVSPEDGGVRKKIDTDVLEVVRKRVAKIATTNANFRTTSIVSSGTAEYGANLIGESGSKPRWVANVEWPLEHGNFLTQQDMDAKSTVALIGEVIRDELFGANENPVGKSIYIAGVPLTVKGVLARHPLIPNLTFNMQMMDQRTSGHSVYVPFSTAFEVLRPAILENTGYDEVGSTTLYIQVSDISNIDRTIAEISESLDESLGVDAYKISTAERRLSAYRDQALGGSIYWLLVAGIAVLTSGGVITSTLHSSLSQRTPQIGLMRALGARKRDVVEQWLADILVICVLGGLIGFSLWYFLLNDLMAAWLETTLSKSGWFMWTALGSAVASGLVFGSYPILKAANVDPIKSLQAT